MCDMKKAIAAVLLLLCSTLSGCALLQDAIPNTPLHNFPNPNPGPGNIGAPLACVTGPGQPPPAACKCVTDGTYGTPACQAG